MWSFVTDPDYQAKLDWVMQFVIDEVAPLDYVVTNHYDVNDATFIRLIRPLQDQVTDRRGVALPRVPIDLAFIGHLDECPANTIWKALASFL